MPTVLICQAVIDGRTPDVCRQADGSIALLDGNVPEHRQLMVHDTGDPNNPCRCSWVVRSEAEKNEQFRKAYQPRE